MKLLMDSSTNYLYLAIYKNGIVDTYVRNGKNDHSETLTDSLNQFLKKNNITVDDIKEVYVGRGPGSYTGVRISGTVAKVLGLVKNLKLYSFSTLDFILASKIKQNGKFLARITAKRNHSYYKLATIENGKINFDSIDLFSEDSNLLTYSQYEQVEVNDELFHNKELLGNTIIEHNLYQEEDVFTYIPNYLRSEING